MILICLFFAWVTIAYLLDRHVDSLRARFMPTFSRRQVTLMFWLAVGILVVTTNEALLLAKLITLVPVAIGHVHHTSNLGQSPSWWAFLASMVKGARDALLTPHKSGGTRT